VSRLDTISQVLAAYGFSFMDLADCSPKAQKTKAACAKAVSFLLARPMLKAEMRNSKQVPIKIVEKNTGLPRKIIERHCKYIIAVVEILNGDYPYILNSRHFMLMPAHPHRATGKAQPAFWLSPQHGVDAWGAQNAQ